MPLYIYTLKFFFYFKRIYLFWLCWVLVTACRIFSCSMQNLVPWVGIEPRPPALGMQSLGTEPLGKYRECDFHIYTNQPVHSPYSKTTPLSGSYTPGHDIPQPWSSQGPDTRQLHTILDPRTHWDYSALQILTLSPRNHKSCAHAFPGLLLPREWPQCFPLGPCVAGMPSSLGNSNKWSFQWQSSPDQLASSLLNKNKIQSIFKNSPP